MMQQAFGHVYSGEYIECLAINDFTDLISNKPYY